MWSNSTEDKEIDEVEVIEECPKKPTASEVRFAVDVLTSHSLFVNEGAEEIRGHVLIMERPRHKREHKLSVLNKLNYIHSIALSLSLSLLT